MIRHVGMFGIFLLTLILPGTLFEAFSWYGIKPDLSMLWVIYIALHHSRKQGAGYAFVAGLMVDFYLDRFLGMYAITFVLVAFLVSVIQERWYKENIPLTMILVFLITFLGQSLMVLVATSVGLNWFLGDAVRVIFGISLYNSLLVPITYPLIHRSFTSGLLHQKQRV